MNHPRPAQESSQRAVPENHIVDALTADPLTLQAAADRRADAAQFDLSRLVDFSEQTLVSVAAYLQVDGQICRSQFAQHATRICFTNAQFMKCTLRTCSLR